MKMKKVFALLLAGSMLAGSAVTAFAEESSVIGSTDPSATVIEHWTFTELFTAFYDDMVTIWNEQNPDKLIQMDVHVLPYDDMHNKLQIALNSGTGAPDTVDIEVGKFANFTEGDVQLLDLTEAAAPYADAVVDARLGLFSSDGKLYGAPTHLGATVAFYNKALLDAAGIDYTTIKTWDDYKAAGSKYYETTGKSFGNLDTADNKVFNLIIAELGVDYVDEDGNLAVNSEGIVKAIEMMRDLQEANAVSLTPGGHPDQDEGYAAYASGDFAAMILPLWMSNRWINYMSDLSGDIVVAPAPVVEDTKALTVGGGGTGTAVVKTSEKADIAAEFIAFAKLSPEASIIQWDTLGNDPLNMDVYVDKSVTENPENKFLEYYGNNPFDTLNVIKDNMVLLDSQTTKYYPSICNIFNTVVFNAIFEDGADIQETLDLAQEDLMNEFGM